MFLKNTILIAIDHGYKPTAFEIAALDRQKRALSHIARPFFVEDTGSRWKAASSASTQPPSILMFLERHLPEAHARDTQSNDMQKMRTTTYFRHRNGKSVVLVHKQTATPYPVVLQKLLLKRHSIWSEWTSSHGRIHRDMSVPLYNDNVSAALPISVHNVHWPAGTSFLPEASAKALRICPIYLSREHMRKDTQGMHNFLQIVHFPIVHRAHIILAIVDVPYYCKDTSIYALHA